MHGRARMRLIGVINIICLVSPLKDQETIKLYKDDFIHALCLIETSCDKGQISYYGKVFSSHRIHLIWVVIMSC